jgi:hypothetical protein
MEHAVLPDTGSMASGSNTTRRCSVRVALVVCCLALSACGRDAVIPHGEAESRIETGPALNAETATYHLAHVQVTLEKVVALPDDMLGLRFSFGAASSDCCEFFPRAALVDATGHATSIPYTDVAVPVSDIGPDGILQMHMWRRGTTHKPSFRVDLAGLGVPTS